MTDLVAEAIALCERQIAEWHRTVTFLGGSKDKHAENQLNSWLTHKAEFGEHKRNQQGYCYAECFEDSGYDSPVQDYPCNFLVTKAKRLLGV